MGPIAAHRRAAGIQRLTGHAAFEQLRRRGRRAGHGAVGLTWLAVPGRRRVAYAVGRRVGSAVVRNRVRRRLRAIISDLAAAVPEGDWLVGARPAAAERSSPELRRDVVAALGELGVTIPGANTVPDGTQVDDQERAQ